MFSTLYKVETGKYKDNTNTVSKIDYYNKMNNQVLKHEIVWYLLIFFQQWQTFNLVWNFFELNFKHWTPCIYNSIFMQKFMN